MAEVEPMKIDCADEMNPKVYAPDQKKRSLKRKRVEARSFPATPEEKQEKINEFRNEINSLVKFCKELVLENREALLENVGKVGHSSAPLNALIVCLMEESDRPLSKIVGEIFEKVKDRTGNGQSVTQAIVKSNVLMLGQRLCYGVTDADADVLEDETECALWCWETRDLKLIPKLERLSVKVCRTCRKKIHERITAVLAMISALGKSEDHKNCLQEMTKASEKLGKVLSEGDIRVLLQNISHKNGVERAEKEAMKGEKLLIKQMEKNKREMEKEKKKMDRELEKEKLQSEKELKRLHDQAEKEEKRREKEEYEIQKQLKRQQEEAEKDQKRKEKEEAELRKQLALKKQASLMERFLKRCTSTTSQQDNSIETASISELSSNVVERKSESVTQAMDSVLAQNSGIDAEAIWKLHLNSWRSVRCSIRSNRKVHWSARQKPKIELVKEIKLTTNKEPTCNEDSSLEKLVDGLVDSNTDKRLAHTYTDRPLTNDCKPIRSKQLLQFDKSHRPAFFGVWPKKSQVARPRNPFAKDPYVDYEIDSDDEWEEDEPGESLSDCDKDDEGESIEANLKGDDEDESEDGFFVPDGYLSENEGVQADDKKSDELVEEVRDVADSDELVQNEEFRALLWQQKYLNKLTELALKKNQPLIISNLMHEKTTSLSAEELTGIEKLERMCLQTLSIRPLPGFTCCIEVLSVNNVVDEGREASSHKSSETLVTTAPALLDSDLLQIVAIIQSCPHSIGKIVESLQNNFSTISKSQLRNKVREISEFSDNHWQVKKEILSKLGLSPEKNCGKPKTITTFFTKRCLPPPAKNVKSSETSSSLEPESESSSKKSAAVIQPPPQDCQCE